MTVETYLFDSTPEFPNNQKLPVVLYRNLKVAKAGTAGVKEHLAERGWTGAWENGIYDFAHYHSTAHEVLVCTSGEAEVRLGDEAGERVTIRSGDAVVLPAGTSHQRLSGSADFTVVGAYPQGQSFDMMYGKPEERPQADRRIEKVPLPEKDPLLGDGEGLWTAWNL
jgi:uncharacterized protein YjlB